MSIETAQRGKLENGQVGRERESEREGQGEEERKRQAMKT